MATAFAQHESRINATIIARLANALAIINGAEVPGILRGPYQAALGGFAESTAPTFLCSTADVEPFFPYSSLPRVTGASQGTQISINGIAYSVTEIHPDGTGLTALILEKA